jgi:hypothetical protein
MLTVEFFLFSDPERKRKERSQKNKREDFHLSPLLLISQQQKNKRKAGILIFVVPMDVYTTSGLEKESYLSHSHAHTHTPIQ